MTDAPSPMDPAIASPKLFSLVITTPPAPPWRQRQMAMLEARQSAPVPIAEVACQIQRLNAWTSRTGRYAAFYVRSADFKRSFTTDVTVDGQTVRVRMEHASDQQRRSARAAVLGGIGAVLLVALAAAVTAAGAQRARLDTALDTAERQASSRLRVAQNIHRRWSEATALEAASRGDTPAGQVLADINWAAARRTPGSRIRAFHWDQAALAVEAVGANPPIDAWDRRLIRSDKPIRSGVWAWATERATPLTPAARGPVVSELK
jgi:hypothetical protein